MHQTVLPHWILTMKNIWIIQCILDNMCDLQHHIYWSEIYVCKTWYMPSYSGWYVQRFYSYHKNWNCSVYEKKLLDIITCKVVADEAMDFTRNQCSVFYTKIYRNIYLFLYSPKMMSGSFKAHLHYLLMLNITIFCKMPTHYLVGCF